MLVASVHIQVLVLRITDAKASSLLLKRIYFQVQLKDGRIVPLDFLIMYIFVCGH